MKSSGFALALLLTLALCPVATDAGVIHVDDSAVGNNDGTSWQDAYTYLQDALAGANAGDEIRVAQGTYKPDQGAGQTPGDREATFQMLNNLTLKGGYAGWGSSDPDARDMETYETILNGDLTNDDSSGDYGTTLNNSQHIITVNAVHDVTLDGLSITEGNSYGAGTLAGSGITCLDATGTMLYQCKIHSNYNGGVRNWNSESTIAECAFSYNSRGRALDNTYSYVDIISTDFVGNSKDWIAGAAIHDHSYALTVSDCLFQGNTAGEGPAITSHGYGEKRIVNCVFIGNKADQGGAIKNYVSSPEITGCIFIGNVATSSDDEGGGAIYNTGTEIDHWSHPVITNCTFVGNSAYSYPVMSSVNGSQTIRNSVIWGNTFLGENQSGPMIGGGVAYVRYSCIEAWPESAQDHVISVDPMFLDADGGDDIFGTADDEPYLLPGSPCVDAGNNDFVPNDVTDVDGDQDTTESLPLDCEGDPRFVDEPYTNDTGYPSGTTIVDMGAYESPKRALVLSARSLLVLEGETVSFNVVLGWAPAGTVDVFVERTSGGAGINVSSGEHLVFDATNYDQPQNVTVTATEGAITGNEEATITVSASGYPAKAVSVVSWDSAIPATVYVDANATGAATGASWADAFCDFQEALALARTWPQVAEIRLAGGLYKPAAFGPDHDATFALVDSVAVRGGYAGNMGPDPDMRDTSAFETVLSGDLDGDDGPDFQNTSENCERVVCAINCSDTTVLDGLTITGGYARTVETSGAGIYVEDGAFKLINCTVHGNYADDNGAGLKSKRANTVVDSCRFFDNVARREGGGIYHTYSTDLTVTNCVFYRNEADLGAGLRNYTDGGRAMIAHCTFYGNIAEDSGGGISTGYEGIQVVNSIFWKNTDAQGAGTSGQIFIEGSSTIDNCCLEGWLHERVGTGNIDADPLFADAADGDFHLLSGSPCVDAGTNTHSVELPDIDYDGLPRPVDGNADFETFADMGAFEKQILSPYLCVAPQSISAVMWDDESPRLIATLQIGGESLAGYGTFTWEVVEDCPWLSVSPATGQLSGETDEIEVYADVNGLTPGYHECPLTILCPGASNSPWAIPVSLGIRTTFYVPQQYPTIQAALDAAGDWGQVVVAPGVYQENLAWEGTSTILQSSDPEDRETVQDTVIDGSQAGPVITFSGSQTELCELAGFTIINGTSDANGGGILANGAQATIRRCTIRNNCAQGAGGGIHGADGLVSGCVLADNTADRGGGIAAYYNSPSLVNCLLTGNVARLGGAMTSNHGVPVLLNCSICDNEATETGGGLNFYYCDLRATNCILWGNVYTGDNEERAQAYVYPVVGDVNHCCLQGWTGTLGGVGNIAEYPDFAFPQDYHLMPGSPCLDAGTETPESPLPSHDLDGLSRVADGDGDGQDAVDMGAYEYSNVVPVLAVSTPSLALRGFTSPAVTRKASLMVRNAGGSSLNWQMTEDCPWVSVAPASGVSSGDVNVVTVTADPNGLAPGLYQTTLTVEGDGALRSPKHILVEFEVVDPLVVPTEYSSIQDAIDAGGPDDIVVILPGRYHERLYLVGHVPSIQSVDPSNWYVVANTIIDGEDFRDEEYHNPVVYVWSDQPESFSIRGLTITDSDPRIYTRGIINNLGGIYCNDGVLGSLENCIVTHNFASHASGGGVSYWSGTIRDCVIRNNASEGRGGGMYYATNVENCIIQDNDSIFGYGGLAGSSRVVNCLFTGNQGNRAGGLVAQQVVNCSVIANVADEGAGIRGANIITNCIIRDNTDHDGNIVDQLLNSAVPTYSCYPGGSAATHSIDTDPGFAGDAYYHLTPDSPCVDAGTNSPAGGLPTTDLDGRPRVVDGDDDQIATVDIGPYEVIAGGDTLSVTPYEIDYLEYGDDVSVQEKTATIHNWGSETLAWEIQDETSWVEVSPASGSTAPGEQTQLAVRVNTAGLTPGFYQCAVAVRSSDTLNPAQLLTIRLRVGRALRVPQDFDTIDAAIDEARYADRVVLAPGTYHENGIIVDKAIAISSTDPCDPAVVAATIIDPGVGSGFTVHLAEDHVLFDGLTIKGASGEPYSGYGTGVYINYVRSLVTVRRCVIRDNNCGIFITGNSNVPGNVSIENCLIWRNRATEQNDGGALRCLLPGTVVMRHCTIADNFTADTCPICMYDGDLILDNTIVWNNTWPGSGQIVLGSPYGFNIAPTLTTNYCNISGGQDAVLVEQGGTLNWGIGNINLDPRFVDPAGGDYHLHPDSPCGDAGDPNGDYEGQTDIDGQPRLIGARVDIGADELWIPEAYLYVHPQSLLVGIHPGETSLTEATLLIDNRGQQAGTWQISESCPYLDITPTNGQLEPGVCQTVSVTIDATGLPAGTYECTMIVTSPDALNPYRKVPVMLVVGYLVPNLYPTIQQAIDAAPNGSEIIVIPGTYPEDINFLGKSLTLRSITPEDVSLVTQTIIQATSPNPIVAFVNSEGPDSILDGFTLTGANHTSDGGGVFASNASPTIRHCIIRDNTTGRGAGIFASGGHVTVEHCTFSQNHASPGAAGGLHVRDNGSATVRNCLFESNTADWGAGLSAVNNAGVEAINCTFYDNTTVNRGGAVFSHANSSVELLNCILLNNTAAEGPQVGISSTAQVTVNYSDLFPGQTDVYVEAGSTCTWGIGNLETAPVCGGVGDYHLKSQVGRWNPATNQWVQDTAQSPCIDAGDPNTPWQNELWPHGRRVNMGVYGNTAQASMSLSTAGSAADLNNDDSVDLADYARFTDAYLLESLWLGANLDRTGPVDLTDLSLFSQEWLWAQP